MSMTVCGLAECVFWLACSLRQGGQHVLGSRRGSRMELPPLQPHRYTKTIPVEFPLPTTVNMSPLLPSDTPDLQVCVCLSTCVLRRTLVQNSPFSLTLSSLTFCACACVRAVGQSISLCVNTFYPHPSLSQTESCAIGSVCVDVFVCVGVVRFLSVRLCTTAGGRENVCVLGLRGSFSMTDVL